jgi:hypothetical protein
MTTSHSQRIFANYTVQKPRDNRLRISATIINIFMNHMNDFVYPWRFACSRLNTCPVAWCKVWVYVQAEEIHSKGSIYLARSSWLQCRAQLDLHTLVGGNCSARRRCHISSGVGHGNADVSMVRGLPHVCTSTQIVQPLHSIHVQMLEVFLI